MIATDRVLDAMHSGEWLRTQWIARVAFDLGNTAWQPHHAKRILTVLRYLHNTGKIERRDATEHRDRMLCGQPVAYDLPRVEWRLTP